MSISALSHEEKEVVRRAMAASFDYFSFDFGARMGIEPDEVRELLDAWSVIDDTSDNSPACLAINNSLNDLLFGEGISEADAVSKVGVSRGEMLRVYTKWAISRGWDRTGVR